jgi:hypothetical protein
VTNELKLKIAEINKRKEKKEKEKQSRFSDGNKSREDVRVIEEAVLSQTNEEILEAVENSNLELSEDSEAPNS